MARPMPRTRPTTSPGTAAGSSRWSSVAVRDNPRAAAPSRYSSGTARKPSSMERIRIGSTMQASVRPPDRIEKPRPSVLQKKALPNSPKTIDGTPAEHVQAAAHQPAEDAVGRGELGQQDGRAQADRQGRRPGRPPGSGRWTPGSGPMPPSRPAFARRRGQEAPGDPADAVPDDVRQQPDEDRRHQQRRRTRPATRGDGDPRGGSGDQP